MARILVIDDETTVREMLTDVLEEEGHEVTCAEDGRRRNRPIQEGAARSRHYGRFYAGKVGTGDNSRPER